MKHIILFSIAVFVAACGGNNSSKIPAAPKTTDEVKKQIAGKSWQVTDVGLSKISMFKKTNGEPEKLEISWMSDTKEMDEFSKESLVKHNGNKFDVSNDGTIKSFVEDYTMYGK